MSLSFHFDRDLLSEGIISMEYVQGEHIISDFFTKAANEDKLIYSMENITIVCNFCMHMYL